MNLPASRSLPVGKPTLEAALKELGIAGSILMEVAWFTPWFRYFNPRARAMGEFSVLGLFLISALLAMVADRALRAVHASASVRTILLLALLTAEVAVCMLVFHPDYPGLSWQAFVARALGSLWTVLEVIPAELVIILSVLYALRTGVSAVNQDVLAPEKLHFRFRLGIVILASFGLIFRQAEGQLMLEVLPVFFGAGLLALAVSRVDRAPPHPGTEAGPLRLAWIGAISAIILVTVGLSQGMSALLQSRIADEVVSRLAAGLLEVLRIVVILIGPLIQVIGVVLAWLIRATASALGTTGGLAEVVQGMEGLAQALPAVPARAPLWLQTHAREMAAGVTGAILALLAWMAIRGGNRARPRRPDGSMEESETAPTRPADRGQGRGSSARPHRTGRPWLTGFEHLLAATSIRRIYGRLLRLANARGRARSPAETPLEILPDLRALFPSQREEVDLITLAYLEVQYGGRLDEDAGIAAVRRAWAAVQVGDEDTPPSVTAG